MRQFFTGQNTVKISVTVTSPKEGESCVKVSDKNKSLK